jgi:hypothetical protein
VTPPTWIGAELLFVDIGAGTTDVCLVQGYHPDQRAGELGLRRRRGGSPRKRYPAAARRRFVVATCPPVEGRVLLRRAGGGTLDDNVVLGGKAEAGLRMRRPGVPASSGGVRAGEVAIAQPARTPSRSCWATSSSDWWRQPGATARWRIAAVAVMTVTKAPGSDRGRWRYAGALAKGALVAALPGQKNNGWPSPNLVHRLLRYSRVTADGSPDTTALFRWAAGHWHSARRAILAQAENRPRNLPPTRPLPHHQPGALARVARRWLRPKSTSWRPPRHGGSQRVGWLS